MISTASRKVDIVEARCEENTFNAATIRLKVDSTYITLSASGPFVKISISDNMYREYAIDLYNPVLADLVKEVARKVAISKISEELPQLLEAILNLLSQQYITVPITL